MKLALGVLANDGPGDGVADRDQLEDEQQDAADDIEAEPLPHLDEEQRSQTGGVVLEHASESVGGNERGRQLTAAWGRLRIQLT